LLSQNGQYKAVIDSVINVRPIWKGQCYYQGIVVKHPSSSVSLSTCHGLRGAIIMENNTYLIVPLNPRNSTSYPHAFVSLPMGSKTRDGKVKPYYLQEPYLNPLVATQMRLNNYVELSLIIDKDMAKELFYFYFDVVNTMDLLLQQIHVRLSIVYAELWVDKNLIDIADDAFSTLDILAQTLTDRVDRNSADITVVLSATGANEPQLAVFTNSVCTNNATGLVRIPEKFHPFFTSQMMMRAIGHILGVLLDDNGTKRGRKYDDKIMESGYKMGDLTERTYMQIYQSTHYLRQNVLALASKDEGRCLLNLPLQVRIIGNGRAKCGNRVVDEGEECDCGTEKMCYAHSCVSITHFQRNVSCPTNNVDLICSGHGSCTNLYKCLCDAGWALHDCSFKMAVNKISAQYFSVKKDGSGEWVFLKHKNEEKCLLLSNGTLSIAACCIGIITCVAVLFYLIQN
ncbi:hypothetical protein M513_03009, partial [Trichuris suis]